MVRKLGFAVLSLVVGTGIAAADGVKDDGVKDDIKKGAQATKREVKRDVHGAFHKAEGTVKSVSATGFVLTDESGKELTFEVNDGTAVRVGDVTHKMSAPAGGTAPLISQYLSANQHVVVRYSKPDDRMVAKDIKVKP